MVFMGMVLPLYQAQTVESCTIGKNRLFLLQTLPHIEVYQTTK